MGGELLASTIHYVQLLAAIVVITRVGVSSDDVLEDLLGGLIPEVSFSRGQVTFVDLLLARFHTRVSGAPRPGREHNHQVCWDQVSHI
jgi:hypothetical protein